MVDSGIILLKYWLEVSPDEQTRRLQGRIDDPRKVWKLSDLDLLSYTRWHDYSRARDDMFKATDTAWAPWFAVTSNDKKRARLNVITHLLDHVPYEPLPKRKVVLPDRKDGPDPGRRGSPRALDPDPVLTRPFRPSSCSHPARVTRPAAVGDRWLEGEPPGVAPAPGVLPTKEGRSA